MRIGIFIVAGLLSACAALPEAPAPLYALPSGTVLTIHQAFVIPAGQRHITLQNGQKVGPRDALRFVDGAIQEWPQLIVWEPHCRIEAPGPLGAAESFSIGSRYVVRQVQTYVDLAQGSVGDRFDLASHSTVVRVADLELETLAGNPLTRLRCELWGESGDRGWSQQDLRSALGNVLQLEFQLDSSTKSAP
jgi:hypothetical protein